MTALKLKWNCFKSNVRTEGVVPALMLIAVVPSRGAAAHKDAIKRYQGCRQIFNSLPFKLFLLLRLFQIVILARVRVPPNFFQSYKVP